MSKLQLILPHQIYMSSYIEALREAPGEDVDLELVYDADWQRRVLLNMHSSRLGLQLKPSQRPETTLWLVEDGVCIGEGCIRRWLSPQLLLYGGHLGYAIRPSRRGRGYGTALLGLLLEEARRAGLVTTLIMCEADNVASRRVIEKHNGLLHDVAYIEIDDEPYCMRRYLLDVDKNLNMRRYASKGV